MRDFYEILGVDENATQDEIKRAYRKKAKQYHPDLNPDNKEEAEQQFKEATAAYEILSNEEMRSRYDRYGHAGVDPQAQGAGFGGFEDIFSDIFGDIFGGFGGFSGSNKPYNGPERGSDLRYDLTIEFEEAIFGTEKEITVRKEENCTTCDGTGAKPGSEVKTCSVCNGSGEVRRVQNTNLGQFVRVVTCENCNGTGEEIEDKCESCNGSGREIKSKTLRVKIPAGVDNGSIISIRGEGEAGYKGGEHGDLYVYINIIEDANFIRRGTNLYLDIPVSFTEVALGAEIEVPTLEGIEKYTLPRGTQTGTTFKLKGHGVPNLRGVGRGDLYFTVNVFTPQELTDRQEELLLEFSEESGEVYKKHKKGFFEKVKDAFSN
ncbi:MAG TPA: molecular chaperone DnaJ [Tissierellaceae bacterium]